MATSITMTLIGALMEADLLAKSGAQLAASRFCSARLNRLVCPVHSVRPACLYMEATPSARGAVWPQGAL